MTHTHRADHFSPARLALLLLLTLIIAVAIATVATRADPLADPDTFDDCRTEGQRLIASMRAAADAVKHLRTALDNITNRGFASAWFILAPFLQHANTLPEASDWADVLHDHADYLHDSIIADKNGDGNSALHRWCESNVRQRSDVLVAFADAMERQRLVRDAERQSRPQFDPFDESASADSETASYSAGLRADGNSASGGGASTHHAYSAPVYGQARAFDQ